MITLISLVVLRPIAVKLKFVDYPNHRKQHKGQIPLIGGISVFFGLLASQIYLNNFNQITSIILVASFLILILGISDDVLNLKAKTKLLIQLILVTLTVYFASIKIESLGYLFGSSYALDLGFLSLPFTIIAVLGLTNAFNMIDGIDGQAVMLTIVAIIGMFLSGLQLTSINLFNFLLGIFAGLIPFLIFNISSNNKIKTFLGDGGSLFLGFTISFTLIYSTQNIEILSPSFALWCVAIPLFDFFSVVILRKIEKRSLIIANRDHIHHFLETFNFSKTLILTLITIFGFLMLILGYYLENNFPLVSFGVFAVIFMIYLFVRLYFRFK